MSVLVLVLVKLITELFSAVELSAFSLSVDWDPPQRGLDVTRIYLGNGLTA